MPRPMRVARAGRACAHSNWVPDRGTNTVLDALATKVVVSEIRELQLKVKLEQAVAITADNARTDASPHADNATAVRRMHMNCIWSAFLNLVQVIPGADSTPMARQVKWGWFGG